MSVLYANDLKFIANSRTRSKFFRKINHTFSKKYVRTIHCKCCFAACKSIKHKRKEGPEDLSAAMYILREGGRKERNTVRANVLDWEYVAFANGRAVQKSSNRRHLLNKDQQDVFFSLNLFQ